MAFNMPAHCSASIKPLLDNSASTHSFQLEVVLDPNLKRMGTGNEVPWRITRSRIEEANGAHDISVLRQQRARHTRPSGRGVYLLWTFGKWAWMSYHGSIWGARSLSRSCVPLPYRNALIRNDGPLHLHPTWQDHRRRLLSPFGGKNLDLLLAS